MTIDAGDGADPLERPRRHRWKPLGNYLTRFLANLATFTAVAALYIAARAANVTNIFWIVVAITVVVTGARPALRAMGELSVRIRNYDALLRRVGQAETKAQELEAERDELRDRIRAAEEQGKEKAYTQMRGMALAFNCTPPQVVEIADENGIIALVGKYERDSEPPTGAWFSVITPATRSLKGAVEVTRIDEESQLAWMPCVEPTSADFWQHLTQRVSYDESPPPNVILIGYQIPPQSLGPAEETPNSGVHEVISE